MYCYSTYRRMLLVISILDLLIGSQSHLQINYRLQIPRSILDCRNGEIRIKDDERHERTKFLHTDWTVKFIYSLWDISQRIIIFIPRAANIKLIYRKFLSLLQCIIITWIFIYCPYCANKMVRINIKTNEISSIETRKSPSAVFLSNPNLSVSC